MSDTSPETETPPESELAQEFRKLGHNLKQTLQEAWQSPASQKLQQEIKAGMAQVEASLSEAARDLREQEMGQKVKAGLADFDEKLRSGKLESDVRRDLASALRAINNELQKARGPAPKSGENPRDTEPPHYV